VSVSQAHHARASSFHSSGDPIMKLIRVLSLAASTLITWALCLAVFLYTQPAADMVLQAQ
jgi:hypothetical protein